ncbi:hypothetical protein CBS9595_001287 [Malassezia furfur]|nr:hypothetical protein CBS9595_001287 [Malassezia furfur]
MPKQTGSKADGGDVIQASSVNIHHAVAEEKHRSRAGEGTKSAAPSLVDVDVGEPGEMIACAEMKKQAGVTTQESHSFRELSHGDKEAMILLVILYMLQGIPVGLAFGTMPFLLKAHLSYTDVGIFMLCTYPYSLKLLWSPIVDTLSVTEWRIPFTSVTLSLGRRKSWIVPVQLLTGVSLYVLAVHVDEFILSESANVYIVTALFFALITMAATQDIAVDGWALTLLSEENVGYASTAQTIGVNIGYFMSFTVFLAFNSVEFGNKYFRSVPLDYPILSLETYLKFCSVAFILVTLWLLFFKTEQAEGRHSTEMSVRQVYSIMWDICSLKHVQLLMLVHLIGKIGFQPNEAVTGLKLVERGLGKEDLALAVLIDFPFQIIFGYLAAMWSKGDRALYPWTVAFVARLSLALVSMGIVHGMPVAPNSISKSYFLLIIASTVLNSFANTVQFVGISAFHTQIADPVIGGTYMTLLNTVSNLGGTWPRYFVLKMVDFFSESECLPPADVDIKRVKEIFGHANASLSLGECLSDAGKAHCHAIGGTCNVIRDGYYWTNTICVAIGAVTLLLVILPICLRLQKIPPAAWRVRLHSATAAR